MPVYVIILFNYRYRPVTEGGPMDQSCTPKKAKAERSLRGTNRSRKDPLWAG